MKKLLALILALMTSVFCLAGCSSNNEKLIIRGSTSMEKFIVSAVSKYCELNGYNPEDYFDIQLEGSSVGKKAVEDDEQGNVIGLSSASVDTEGVESFNVCLDAVAVIVNKDNTQVSDLTLAQLYDIFSGKTLKFNSSDEKNITVVAREQGSGTREAFDKVVTNGTNFLEEKDSSGKKVYNTTQSAIIQTKTGTVLSSVNSDKFAIGYVSLGSVDESVKLVKVGGVSATESAVLDGSYKIQRPFVVMSSQKVQLTDLCADFLEFLKSSEAQSCAEDAGCIFLTDPTKRANQGKPSISVGTYQAK